MTLTYTPTWRLMERGHYAGVVQGAMDKDGIVWVCRHNHRTADTARECAEKNLAWIKRDRECVCFHPHPGGRHTADCEAATDSQPKDEV